MIFKIIEVNMKKKMLLISSLLLLNNAFGNSPTAESLRERDKVRDLLDSKPAEAKYIFVGKIVEARRADGYVTDIVFVVERSWTKKDVDSFSVRDDMEFTPGYQERLGKPTLSVLRANDLSLRNYMMIEKLSNAKPLMYKLSKKKDFVGDINPAWQFCEKDSECKSVKNKCGRKISVNNFYEKNYLDFLSSKDSARIDCKKETDKKPALVKNKCVEYFCE